MRLLSFAVGDYVSYGAVNGDGIVDLGRLLGEQYPTLGAVLRGGELHRAVSLGGTSKPTISLAEIRYLPTVTDPEKIVCIGINYPDRNAEYKDGAEAPKYPSVFMRTPGSLVGHLEPIVNPPESKQLDYEGEIVLVIGKAGRRIAAADAWQHVAGLALMNEGSVRDWLRHSKFNVTPGKNFERSGSFGPWLVTADEIPADGEPAPHDARQRRAAPGRHDGQPDLPVRAPHRVPLELHASDAGRRDRHRHADGRRRALRPAEIPARRRYRRDSRARARHLAQRRRRRA